jgi:UDP-MurNAc hydroxylase
MRVTAIGHAGLKVETARSSVLVDPWFSPEGAFQASWFQYPSNEHLLEADGLERPTAVVISHEHLDHIDPWFLRRLPDDVPVVVPQYPSPVLLRKLEAAGRRNVTTVPQWEPFEIADGLTVFFVSEESPINHDSAIVIQADGRSLLNLNDARLSPIQLREMRAKVGGTVDVFTFQGAGASWYPMVYDYDAEKSDRLSAQKRAAKFGYTKRTMEIVEPVIGLPFAGPPAFLDPDLFHLNREMERGIFPDQRQVADWLAERGLTNTEVLLPGDAWDADARRVDRDPHWEGFDPSRDRDAHLAEYAARRSANVQAVIDRHPEPAESLWEPFREYFERLLGMSDYFNRRIGMRVGFDVTGPGGGAWAVEFREGSRGVYDEMGEVGYRYRFAGRWLPPILEGTVPWEDFMLSCRFEAWRSPDLYNDHLLGLLKFADAESLRAVEAFETSPLAQEYITVHAEGRSYRIERYCPHAGNDLLETGEVLPGRILRCLAHHYEFDLETGDCVNGTCPALETEPAEEPVRD